MSFLEHRIQRNSTIESPETDVAVGCVIFLLSFTGFVLNLLAFSVLVRHRSFRSAFGMLAATHSAADACVLFCFLGWAAPLTAVHYRGPMSTVMNRKVGQFINTTQTISFLTVFATSLNRLCAIRRPNSYRTLFSIRNTRIYIGVIVIVSCAYGLVYFFPFCDFYFNAKEYYWMFEGSQCGQKMSVYIDFIGTLSLFGTVMIVDIFCLTGLLVLRKNLAANPANRSDTERKARRRRDLLFFAQVFVESACFLLAFFSYHILAVIPSQEDKWGFYATETLPWNFAHTASGVIVVSFNSEIRRRVCSPRLLYRLIVHADESDCETAQRIAHSRLQPPKGTRSTSNGTPLVII